jgi:hypothetical protein
MEKKFDLKYYLKSHTNKLLLGLIALVVMSIYIFITTWQNTTYQEVHSMYPIEKSKNPEASEEFLKAMEYRIYIKELHPYFDYDSFVMAPFLEKLDYHFKRGKALLPKDSVEDIVWWTLFYKEIYGLLVPPRNDNSLAYENLPPQEFKKVHDEVYEMIMRYSDGEVYFNLKEIDQFRFKAMAILVGFYYKEYSNRYEAESMVDKAKKANKDTQSVDDLKQVQKKYTLAYKKFITNSKNKNFMENEYASDQIYIASELIVKYVRINNTQRIPHEICNSENTKLIIEHIEQLLSFVKDNSTNQSNTIDILLFNKNYSNVPVVMKLLEYRCPNLQPEITQVVQSIEQFNQTRNKK